MTDGIRKTLCVVGWTGVIAVAVMLLLYNVCLELRQRSLRQQLLRVSESVERVRRELEDGKRTRSDVRDLFCVWRSQEREIAAMLSECESREDFVVREGKRIAWSLLSSSTDKSKRIAVYVPRGRHYLKYAVLGNAVTQSNEHKSFNGRTTVAVSSPTIREREHFIRNDVRVRDAVSCELNEQSGVYELELRADGSGPAQISLTGLENVTIHEGSVSQSDGTCKFGLIKIQSSPGLLSGLKPEANELPAFEVPSATVTDLALFNVLQPVGGGHVQIRFWIETEDWNASAHSP